MLYQCSNEFEEKIMSSDENEHKITLPPALDFGDRLVRMT